MIVSQVLMMEDIIHRHRDLFAYLLEKFKIRFTIGFFLHTLSSNSKCNTTALDGLRCCHVQTMLHALE